MKTAQALLCATLCALGTSGMSGGTKHTDIIEASFDASNLSMLEAHTFGGHIKVTGEDREDISITAEQVVRNADSDAAQRIFEEIEKTMEVRDNTLYVKFKYDRNNSWNLFDFFSKKPSVNVNITISTPKTVAQKLSTSGGPIEAKRLAADIKAGTSGGHMTFIEIAGNINANTSGGHIKAESIDGTVILRTSGGHIKLDTISSKADIRTSGGNMTLTNMYGPTIAKTNGGHINADFPEGISDNTNLRTSGGSVTVKLPSDQAFHLNASTSGGRVESDFPVTMQDKLISNKAEGDVNGGGPDLNLHTSGGNIKVKYL